MADKHLLIVDKMPTDEEFMSDTWTSRLDYVGLVKNVGGGVNTDEVFYNFNPKKVTESDVTILKVRIEEPGDYGFGYINGDISDDKPTIINWGNGKTTTLTTETDNVFINYSKPDEYEISIDGWYNNFKCGTNIFTRPNVTQICYVLIEAIKVSSLITNFGSTFSDCSNLKNIPSGLFDNNVAVTSFYRTFYDCKSLTNIPSGLFDKNTGVTSFDGTFFGCESLKSIPDGLFDKNINVTSFNTTFSGCSILSNIPSRLFDNNRKVTTFESIFHGCINLRGETPYTLLSDNKTRIKLWDRNGENGFAKSYGHRAFYNCRGLTDFGSIPDKWKK